MAKEEEEKEEKEGAEEGATEGEEGLNPPKKKLSPKMMAIIGAALLLVLGGGGAGLYFSGVLGGHGEAPAEGTAEGHGAQNAAEGHGGGEAEEEGTKEAAGAPVFYSLGDIIVNLAGDNKRPNYLKMKVVLELSSEKDVPTLETLKPRIIDHFQVYLRELRIEDLRGSSGLYRLREELLLRVTEAVQPIRVRDVLFQEMLVQ